MVIFHLPLGSNRTKIEKGAMDFSFPPFNFLGESAERFFLMSIAIDPRNLLFVFAYQGVFSELSHCISIKLTNELLVISIYSILHFFLLILFHSFAMKFPAVAILTCLGTHLSLAFAPQVSLKRYGNTNRK